MKKSKLVDKIIVSLILLSIVLITYSIVLYNNYQQPITNTNSISNVNNISQSGTNSEFEEITLNYTNTNVSLTKLTTKAGTSSGDLKIMLNFPVIPSYYGLTPEYIEVEYGSIIADSSGIYVYVNTKSEENMYDDVGWIMKFDHNGNLIWSYITFDKNSMLKIPFMFQDDNNIYLIGRRVSDDKLLMIKLDKDTGFGKYEALLVNDRYPSSQNGLKKFMTLYGTDAYKFVNGDIKVLLQPYVMVDFTNRSITYIYDNRFTGVDPYFHTYAMFKMLNGKEVIVRSQTKVTNGGYDILVRVYETPDVAKDFYFFGTKYNDFILSRWPIVDDKNIVVVPSIIKIPQTSGYFTLLAFSKTNGSLLWSKTIVLPMDEAGITPMWFDNPTENVFTFVNSDPYGCNNESIFNYNIIKARVVDDIIEYTILVSRDSTKGYCHGYSFIPITKLTYTNAYVPYLNKEFYPPARTYYRDIIYKLRINVTNGNIVSLIKDSNISYYSVGATGVYFDNVISTPGSIYDFYVDKNGHMYLLYLFNKRVYIVKTTLDRTSLYNVVYRTYPISYGLGKPNNFAIINVKLISTSES